MSEHTPGPWSVFGDAIIALWSKTPQPDGSIADGKFIAHRVPENDRRLVASAPDLLAACEFALEWIRESIETGSVQAKGWGTIELEQAIAKAKGEKG